MSTNRTERFLVKLRPLSHWKIGSGLDPWQSGPPLSVRGLTMTALVSR